MGLKSDIAKAFEKTMTSGDGKLTSGQKNVVDELSKDLTDAITNFLTKQDFRVAKLESEIDINKIETAAHLEADVSPIVMSTSFPAGSPGPPIPLVGGIKGVIIPALKLDKTFGQGGALTVKGTSNILANV